MVMPRVSVADGSGTFTVSTSLADAEESRELRVAGAVRGGSEPYTATATGDTSGAVAQGGFTEGRALTDGQRLLEHEGYWATRQTYPTGRFDPEWVRQASAQDRHGGCLEVAAGGAEGGRDVGDDAEAVGPEDGDDEEAHRGRLLARRVVPGRARP